MPLYYRVSPAIWNEPWDDDTRTLAFYILTSPHRTTEGLFKLPTPYIQADIGWTPRKIEKNMARLEEVGFVRRHGDTILIRNALKYQSLSNDNQVKAVLTGLETVPPSPLDDEFASLAKRFCERLSKRLGEWFPERFANALALDSSSSSPQAPSPSRDVDVGAEPHGSGKSELQTHLLAEGFPEPAVALVCGRIESRLRFGGEPIRDPEAWARKALGKLSLADTEGEGAVSVVDGVTYRKEDGEWVEAS